MQVVPTEVAVPCVLSVLMCHAPIVVPGVAAPAEARRCGRTTRAMAELAARVVAAAPDRVVVVSPHAPRRVPDFAALVGPRHRGSLAAFGAPHVAVDLPDDVDVRLQLGLAVARPPDDGLDHGAVVPLAFLWDAGWRGPTAILAHPRLSSAATARRARELGAALAGLPGRTAMVASGDMSHRLIPGAPAGFHADARRFDQAFVDALRADDWAAAAGAQPRDVAAEDVVDSSLLAMAAAGEPQHAEVLSYEGPWGVGYTEAVLADPSPPLYAVARRSIDRLLRGAPRDDRPGGGPARGVFVSLHDGGGALRGCIGHMAPTRDSLWEEVAEVARQAATRDPRFPSLRVEELADLTVEVDVLSPTRPVDDLSALDPRKHGVEVRAGSRRGVLLPDLPGVDSVSRQLEICRQKGGIGHDEPVQVHAFTVDRQVQP